MSVSRIAMAELSPDEQEAIQRAKRISHDRNTPRKGEDLRWLGGFEGGWLAAKGFYEEPLANIVKDLADREGLLERLGSK